MARGRRAWRKLLVLLGSAAVAGGIGEAGARLLLPPPERHVYVASAPGAGPAPGPRGAPGLEALFVPSPGGIRLRPHARVVIENHALSRRTIEITTNALGYRNPEIGPGTRRRVLFLGDSITLADYLPEEETFVRLVERLAADGPEPLETINAGVSMLGLTSELALLRETGLSTRPDVVVLGFYLNDLQDSVGVETLRPPGWLAESVFARHLLRALSVALARRDLDGYLTRLVARQPGGDFSLETWRAWRDAVAARFPPGPGDPARDRGAFHRAMLKNFMDWGVAWSDEAWRHMTPVFRELRELADRHGVVLRIVAFPVRQQVEADFVADEPQRRLREVAAALGVPLLDLLPVLREAHRRQPEPLFYDHCHHTPRGSRVVAEAVLAFLRATPGAR